MTDTAQKHPIRRILPAWMHRAYARARDIKAVRVMHKRWGLTSSAQVGFEPSWRPCPNCGQEFGLHELKGHAVFYATVQKEAWYTYGPMCPSCCALLRRDVSLPKDGEIACPKCDFHAGSMTALGKHMEEAHGSEKLRTPKFEDVETYGPKPPHWFQPKFEILVSVYDDNQMSVKIKNSGDNWNDDEEVARTLRAAAMRIDNAHKEAS